MQGDLRRYIYEHECLFEKELAMFENFSFSFRSASGFI